MNEDQVIMSYRLLSRGIFSMALLFFSLISSDVRAEKTFAGTYGGLGIGYGYTHGKFNGISYKGMSLSTGVHAGHGWVREQLYYGIEGGLRYDAFSKKKGGSYLKQPWQGALSLRIGRVLRSYFLPFMRVGISRDHWTLRSLNHKTRFNATMLLLGVGVDAFVNDHISIRSEFDYASSVGLNDAKLTSSKKPIKAGLKIGISYHF
jgi:hypothetical protein